MSFPAMAWAVRQKLPCTQKIVLLMLAERHNKDTADIDSQSSQKRLKYAHCKKNAVGCGSPIKARGISRNTARYAAFSIPVTSFGGSDGMASAMPVTLRVPPVFHTHSSCRPMWKWNGSCLPAQLELSMSKSIGASLRQSFSVSDPSDYEEAIAAENKAVADIKQMARDNAVALRMLWRWGAGDGSGVLEIIANEIELRSPFDFPQQSTRAVKGKQVMPAGLRKRVFERDAYRCVHCATHIDLSIDHIQPESKGGTLDFENLQTLCRSCNSKKGAR